MKTLTTVSRHTDTQTKKNNTEERAQKREGDSTVQNNHPTLGTYKTSYSSTVVTQSLLSLHPSFIHSFHHCNNICYDRECVRATQSHYRVQWIVLAYDAHFLPSFSHKMSPITPRINTIRKHHITLIIACLRPILRILLPTLPIIVLPSLKFAANRCMVVL